MNDVAVAFACLFAAAIFVLIVVLGCLDEQTAENRRLRAASARRILELEQEKNR